MNENVNYVKEQRIYRTIKNLEKNNINGYYVKSEDEIISLIENLIDSDATISVGGSTTLMELGLIEYFRQNDYNFLDRYQDGLTSEKRDKLYRECFFADAYVTSTNAITEKGEIYNVDGRGNRVAAMIYGPKKVIIIAGVNKIVKDLDDAIQRNEEIAAPANTRRLDMDTPCKELGYCTHCKSDDRICNKYTVIKRDFDKDRIHVVFINDALGF